MTNNFLRGIKLNEDFHFAKFRFDRQFRLVSADDFMKQLLSSETVQNAFAPLESLKTVQDVAFKQM